MLLPLAPKTKSSPKLPSLQCLNESVEDPPTPHVLSPQVPAPHPVKGAQVSGPVFIWYLAVTEPPPPETDEEAAEVKVIV